VYFIRDFKARTAMAKAALNKKTLFASKLDVELRKKLVKCYIWGRVCMVRKLGLFGN
jgi:hypothetical protein